MKNQLALRKRTSVVLILPIFFLTSCSLVVPGSQSVNILPSSPRADVYVDGNLIGKGPQSVSMKKSSSHSIMAKCGGSAGTGVVDHSLSTTGILDIIGGFLILVPFLGLLAPGAWKLSPESISVAIPDDSACK